MSKSEFVVKQVGEWVSINDGLPLVKQRVLIAPQAEVAIWNDGEWLAADGRCKYHCVTHWQHLPTFPDEQLCVECTMRDVLVSVEELGKAASEVARRMAERFSECICCHCVEGSGGR